ncbi:UDP-N-acetylmuramoyl-L-alanine--D-glutamate ligase [Pseudoalteromonas xiamenensis]|uniref:UDP-N-acetylmuramoylalanine--D-glutamate ligase n=1 Tax=Pseudoalteromonas xiamenensis TaxID=882626 RepID=A0A975DJ69_9GAMM|nr:UDP-N-acetylmuramoyl-L-alanine--D-glutamate ligase [Pseudoalteromonas xiamenensis]QTH72614.1 UDP-N-acetylmuramoyl-L-alanine--D-glutamate ligase [Pseudoalteromonas xiamenensis]
MTYLDELKQKNIIVLGLGITGIGIVRFLLQHGITPKVVDSRNEPPGAAWLSQQNVDCDAVFGNLAEACLHECDLLIVSPGIPLYEPNIANAITHGVEVIGDIELFARFNDKPVVAVTGSNGKSTVVSLAAAVLKEAGFKVGLGGNIGTAALDLLSLDADVYVLELSSFQLETTHTLHCESAMILNLSEDHMDRYADFAAYCAAKQRIYSHAKRVVVNADDENTHFSMQPNSQQERVTVSLTQGDYSLVVEQQQAKFSAFGEPWFSTNALSLLGGHNQFNALSVMALLQPFNVPVNVFERVFTSFVGLPHRCALVAEVNGVRYINDSKATNVGATIAAIESLNDALGKMIVIVGGDAKGADLSVLKFVLRKYCKSVLAFGQDGKAFLGLHPNAQLVADLGEAVGVAAAQATSGDQVLLAPACASIDMYSNYVARGEHFVSLVEAL